MADELDELRAEAVERGIAFDGRWGVERMREALANADNAEDQADDDEPVSAPAPKPSGYRAGGHVLRDGRWVIEGS